MAIVANSAKTTAFRVGKLPKGKLDYDPEDENPPVPVTDAYPITAGPVTVPENVSAEVVDALLDSDTYDKSQGNFCDFEPGVRFTFNSNDGQVDVFICLECDQLVVHLNGKRVGGGYCEFARPVLLRATKRLFPKDEIIHKLPDKVR